MKIFFIIIFSALSFFFLSNQETSTSSIDNVVLKLSNLDHSNIKYVLKDLNNIYGVRYCRISGESNSIFIQYNDSLFNFKNLYTLLNKWNLEIM